MRSTPILLLAVFAWAFFGCSVLMPVAEVATRPLDKKNTFEELQSAYTSNIRYGLWEDALPHVEPELQPRFKSEMTNLRELRFSDVRTESIEIDALRTEAVAVVVYRGYALSSPFEREIRIVQFWRRAVPTQAWYITPDFDGLLSPRDVSRAPGPASGTPDRALSPNAPRCVQGPPSRPESTPSPAFARVNYFTERRPPPRYDGFSTPKEADMKLLPVALSFLALHLAVAAWSLRAPAVAEPPEPSAVGPAEMDAALGWSGATITADHTVGASAFAPF